MDDRTRQKLLPKFRETTADRVERIHAALLRLEREGGAAPREELARELHTLKGEARLMGYGGLSQVVHAAEGLLGAAGDGAGPATGALARAAEAFTGLLDGPLDGGDAARLLAASLEAATGPAAAHRGDGARGAGSAARAAAPAPEGRAAEVDPQASSVRVDVTRLDQLSALAGELLVDGAKAVGRTRDLQALFGRWTRLADQQYRAVTGGHSVTAKHVERWERDLHLLKSDTFRFLRRHADAVGAVYAQFELLVDRVGAARLIPLGAVLEGFPRAARDLAAEQGKEAACEVAGGDVAVDRAILLSLRDPLVHLLRNCVDHGLETPAEREAAGKPRAGRISIEARLEGGQLAVAVEDDGRGIDGDRVRAAAIRRGLISEAQAAGLGERALLDLLFQPGFTTREAAGEISGRGVGLDVVRRKVTEVGGSIVVEAWPGKGARFTLRMPQSLAILKVLMVRIDDDVYGIPAADVESVERIDPVDLTEVAGIRAVRHRGRLVPVVALGPLLSLNGGPRARRPVAAFLVHGRDAAAVVVDGLAGEREVAVKPPGPFLAGMRFLAGAASMPDGRAALLLSTPDLVSAARRLGTPVPAPQRGRRRLRVLLVDDSAIARDTGAAMLRALGHEVEEAVDGEDGWARLQAGGHQLLLTDVQMPVLDGVELTRRVKGSARFSRLPVVILSSLSAPEERRRGVDAGADAYLVKGEMDAEVLSATLERLCGVPR